MDLRLREGHGTLCVRNPTWQYNGYFEDTHTNKKKILKNKIIKTCRETLRYACDPSLQNSKTFLRQNQKETTTETIVITP